MSIRLSPYILSIFIGYIVGSFPTAYILLKRKNNVDIRVTGTGNVGAMNAYEITNSKSLGFVVMIVDLVKGLAAVLIGMLIFGKQPLMLSITGLSAIVGHNYPVWLKFKGGKGLSTAAGVLLVLGWVYVAVWCLLWVLYYLLSKDINKANVIALIISPVLLSLMPAQFLESILPAFVSPVMFVYLGAIISCLILVRHGDALKEFWKSSPQSTT